MSDYNRFSGNRLPCDYDVVEGGFTEQLTNFGQEASMTYHGPGIYRYDFLKEVFGTFSVGPDGCCYVQDPLSPDVCVPPIPYPSIACNMKDIIANQGIPVCTNSTRYLWPDTYQIRNNGELTSIDCVDPEGVGSHEMRKPLASCEAEITVNYREKYLSPSWPPELEGLICSCNFALLPAFSVCTFMELREFDNSTSFLPIPGRDVNYDIGSVGATNANCDTSDEQVPDDIDVAIPFDTTVIEICWSNLPVINYEKLDAVANKVNSDLFLGFPEDSLFLERPKVKTRRIFCDQVRHEICFRFIGKTAQFSGFPCGKMGLWNRRWRRCPIEENGHCHHWVPISTQRKCGAVAGTDKVIDSAIFNGIFELPSCGP